MTKVDQLPSELLSLILSYLYQWDLPSCALVNRSFFREAMPLLWREISVESEKSFLAIPTCVMQSPHGRHVRSLSIKSMVFYADFLEQIHDVPYLEWLGNSMISLQHMPRYCPHLTSLEIQDCGYFNPVLGWIVHAMVVSAGQYCKQLTRLVLHNYAYSNDDDDLFGALTHAPLTEFCLHLPYQPDMALPQQFLETAPLTLHRYPLTSLKIKAHNDLTDFITTINTHGLTWPHLTTFDLWRCESLTNGMALTFVQAHPTLKCLGLGYSQLGDVFLDGLVDALPNLTMLDVQCNPAMTAPGLCRLITNYGGRLKVVCIGSEIYPEDVPNDKTYGYGLRYGVLWDEGDHVEVDRFDGSFYDYSDLDSGKIFTMMES